jgi:hypothetical protein
MTATPQRRRPREFLGLKARNIDNGDVVGEPVRHVEFALVRRKLEMPGPLADENVLLHLIGLGIDDRDAVGRPKRREQALAVLGELHADRLERFRADSSKRTFLITFQVLASITEMLPPTDSTPLTIGCS